MFKTTIAAAVLLVATAAPVVANPYALKCITVEGYPPVDLTIDLDRKVMKWGSGSDKIEKFTISDVTEEYITGLRWIMPLSQVGPYVVFWAHACATGGREGVSNGEGTNSNRISG